ncbi:hypothetical protein EON68_03970, partial [archaeon]
MFWLQGDLDEEGEDRLKQLFLVRKIYNNMLSRRLRDDQRRTDRLALAFQRIRTATGLSDVDAIISKYEQRDATVLALQAQMKAARDRVDALAAERKQLVWALDEVQTLSASALESRALYNSVEERDRRLADAAKQARESRDRLHRVGLTVEACRACIVNMLERLGQDATFLNGVVAGTTATGTPSSGTRATPARRGSASSSPLRTTSPAGVPPTTAGMSLTHTHTHAVPFLWFTALVAHRAHARELCAPHCGVRACFVERADEGGREPARAPA